MISISERLRIKEEKEKKAFDNFDFNLRCASPGIIQSFDSAKQTVVVQVAITERIKINGTESVEKVPLLVDVPIVIPQIKGYSMTLPIQAGDECLVVFSDTCFDAWYQSGGIQNQMSLRRHDLSDGFAIIGVKSQPNVIPNYSTNSIQIRNNAGDNFFELSQSSIRLVFGASEVKADASGIIITGATVTIVGDTNIEGRDWMDHVHSGVEDGNDNTDGVV